MYECCNMMSLLRDMKFVSCDRIFLLRDKSVDLTGVLSCRATLLSKPDPLLFRTIAGTGDLLSNHVLSIL